MTAHDIAATFFAFGFLAFVVATIANCSHRAITWRKVRDEDRRRALKKRIREEAARMRGEWGTL